MLEFKVGSYLKNIIGKDLITDDYIAVFELVKNSFDAHAKNVVITFEEDKIIIADNGKGMSLDNLKDKWLFVAYSAKEDGSEDNEFNDKNNSYRDTIKIRKHYAGAKGIGRFSCDKLGKKLKLITKKIGSKDVNVIEVNWEDFEKNPKEEFRNIKVKHSINNHTGVVFPSNTNNGTILEISNVEGNWTRTNIKGLRHSLEKLINPFSDKKDFRIEIVCLRELKEDNQGKYSNGELKGKPYLDRDKVNGTIQNSILDVLDLKTTQINVIVENNIISTQIYDRGTLIYKIKENNDFNFIKNLKMDLYFLNTSAKTNFTRRMGTQVVKFGSVFLFKNGFRVQPYGSVGDDSWGLDYRGQQGYNRTLGTRDVFGRVDIITEDNTQFKEVTSRDGGLVETVGYKQLLDIFKEKALKRLERYVVGVLWGEGFKRRNYFGNEDIANNYRNKLKEIDKESDNIDAVKSNLGSKIDFIKIIKSLANDKNVEILEYNKDLIDVVNENLEDVNTKFISDIEFIADKTNDVSIRQKLSALEKKYQDLEKAKKEAERKSLEEEKRRIKAEHKAKQQEQARIKAEKAEKAEREKRRKAEDEKKDAELKKLKAENDKKDAELKRLKAEKEKEKAQQETKKTKDKLSIEKKKNQYLNATRKTLSDDAEQLVHSINLYIGNTTTYIDSLMSNSIISKDIKEKVYAIKSNVDKALKVSQLIIKSNFDYKHINQRVNLPLYIKEYTDDLQLATKGIKIKTQNVIDKMYFINPIDIDIVLDNLVSNSEKAKASNILIEFKVENKKLEIIYSDDGIGMPEKLVNNSSSIFELGVRESSEAGSGIGMYDVKKRVESMKGEISFLGNGIGLKGVGFLIKI